jgi:alginate O-acetyltransferase complex protein AlgI
VIADFMFLMWTLAIAVPLFWAVPAAWRRMRLGLVSLVSCALLWLLSPIILVVVTVFALFLAGFVAMAQAGVATGRLKTWSWGVFAPLIAVDHIPPAFLVQGLLGAGALSAPAILGFAFLGASYTAIRTFILIRESLDRDKPRIGESLAALTFFGSFVAGPIAGALPWRTMAERLNLDTALMGLARIGWGGAMFLVIKPNVAGLDVAGGLGLTAGSTAALWLEVLQRFVVLYIDFSGYSDIAIGCGLLFGVRLPENFNWPLRARSIQEFWQRWHMSLGAFIGAYLFRPLVRHTGRPSVAIFTAFLAVGLWHQITWPYLFWGFGHGAALAINMILNRTRTLNSIPAALRSIGGWVFTMSYVAVLSSIANAADTGAALMLVSQLAGF